jgi:hypothetical protein
MAGAPELVVIIVRSSLQDGPHHAVLVLEIAPSIGVSSPIHLKIPRKLHKPKDQTGIAGVPINSLHLAKIETA